MDYIGGGDLFFHLRQRGRYSIIIIPNPLLRVMSF